MTVGLLDVERELQAYVSSEVLRQRTNVAVDAPLVETGLVDSLGLLQIIVFIERQYAVKLTESGGPRDFRTIASLSAAVERIRAAPNAAQAAR